MFRLFVLFSLQWRGIKVQCISLIDCRYLNLPDRYSTSKSVHRTPSKYFNRSIWTISLFNKAHVFEHYNTGFPVALESLMINFQYLSPFSKNYFKGFQTIAILTRVLDKFSWGPFWKKLNYFQQARATFMETIKQILPEITYSTVESEPFSLISIYINYNIYIDWTIRPFFIIFRWLYANRLMV